jgi:hypothetical protein
MEENSTADRIGSLANPQPTEIVTVRPDRETLTGERGASPRIHAWGRACSGHLTALERLRGFSRSVRSESALVLNKYFCCNLR